MAWYALYKWFIPWRKTPYINWINWYKRHLYDEWFSHLSEYEQKAELERQQRIKEKRKHDGAIALARLEMIFSVMNEATHGKIDEYMRIARDIDKMNIRHSSRYW